MANDIKTGETFGDFRVTSVTPLYEQGETAVMLSHGPTGLQWLHFLAGDPVSSCAIGEEIKKTLLEALDAGMGHETISVKASEEAIAEANLALPEELKLQVR